MARRTSASCSDAWRTVARRWTSCWRVTSAIRRACGTGTSIACRSGAGSGGRLPCCCCRPIIARLYRRTAFDLLRVHSLRYIGPAALIARRGRRRRAHRQPSSPSRPEPPQLGDRAPRDRRVRACHHREQFSRRQLVETARDRPRSDRGRAQRDRRALCSRRGARAPASAGLGDGPVALFSAGSVEEELPGAPEALKKVARARDDAVSHRGGGPLESTLQQPRRLLGSRVIFAGRIAGADKVAITTRRTSRLAVGARGIRLHRGRGDVLRTAGRRLGSRRCRSWWRTEAASCRVYR